MPRVPSTVQVQSTRPVPEWLIKAARAAYRKNKTFFGTAPKTILITLCSTQAEWKKESRYYYFAFARGLVLRNGEIVLKSPELAKRNPRSYAKIITHEMNHAFWIANRRGQNMWCPIWLVEAMACLVALNDVLLSRRELRRQLLLNSPPYRSLPFKYSAKLFPTALSVKIQYSLWYFFLRELLGNTSSISKSKILKTLSHCSTKKAFNAAFKTLFNSSLTERYRDFFSLLAMSN